MHGTLIAIYAAPERHSVQLELDAAQLMQGKGLVGDRFYGFRKSAVGKHLTLISLEAIAHVNREFGLTLPPNATRRNLITQGMALETLIGQRFRIGNAVCRGVELCEPCVVMARQFPVTEISNTALIHAFTGKAGIRAEVLGSGVIRSGDAIALLPEE